MIGIYYVIIFFVVYPFVFHTIQAQQRQCTAKCRLKMSFNDLSERPSNCSRRTLSYTCVARVTILYNIRQIFVDFQTTGSEYKRNDSPVHAIQQVSHMFKSNSTSYMIIFGCFFDDDCDWIYIQDIINRYIKIDYTDLFNQLKSLLYDTIDTGVSDCYSQNDTIDCSDGLCSSIIFEGNSRINRSCMYPLDFNIGIDIRRHRVFPIISKDNQNYLSYQCNQNLCNNPTTENRVQSIVQSYIHLLDIPQPSKSIRFIKTNVNYLIVSIILLHLI